MGSKGKKKIFIKFALVLVVVIIIVLLMLLGSLYFIFRNDLKEFSKNSQEYYNELEVTEEGISDVLETTQSANQTVPTETMFAVIGLNKYNRIASNGNSSIQRLISSNAILDVTNVANTLDVTKSMILVAQAEGEKEKIPGKKSLNAQEVAKNITSLGRYISDSKNETKEEKLAYLLNAEAASRFPYIESIADDETKLNGIIKFKRYSRQIENTENVKEYQLSYVGQTKFDELYAKFENAGDKTVFKHFTIDDEQNVVIAGGVETTNTVTTDDTEITVDTINEISAETYSTTPKTGTYQAKKYRATRQVIDYKSLTEQYALPFNLLATFLIQTRDYNLVKDLATLVYESEIIIGIYDNEAETVRESKYTYSKLVEYTESTEMNFSSVEIDINNAKYKGVTQYCKGTVTTNENGETLASHTIYDGKTTRTSSADLHKVYISKLTADGKISATTNSEENVFTTNHKIVTKSYATSTKGVILADIWVGKWTTTYDEKTETFPSNGDGEPVQLQNGESQEIQNTKFEDKVYKDVIEPTLTAHSEDLKEDVIKQILKIEEAEGTFDVPVEEVTAKVEKMNADAIREHALSGKCTGKGNESCIRKLSNYYQGKGKPINAWRKNVPGSISDSELLNDVNTKSELKIVKEHVKQMIQENNKKNIEDAEKENQKRKEKAAQEEKKKKDAFEKDLKDNLLYNQALIAQKTDVNINCLEENLKTATTYEKGVTKTEDVGQQFKKILNKAKYHETRESLLTRTGWFWDSIDQNEDTAKLKDVIRYLFNIAFNTDYFGNFSAEDIEKMLSIFEPKIEVEFVAIGGGISKYLLQFGGSATQYTFDDVSYYKMYDDTAGNPTIGPGDVQWLSNHDRFNETGTVRFGGENGTTYENCNVQQKVNELLGPDGYKTKWNGDPPEEKSIYIDVETVDNATDSMQSIFMELVLEETSSLNLSKQQIYALTYIKYSTGNLSKICGGETNSITKTFVDVYNEASAKGYEIDSPDFNKYIWENWWSIKWAGGYQAGRTYTGWLKGRDASFETYVKGTLFFDGGNVFSREKYIYYSKDDIQKIGFSTSSSHYINARVANDSAEEEEIFTYEVSAGVYEAINDAYRFGIYTSSSGRTYVEWIQTTANEYGQLSLFTDGLMGKSGCNVYGYTMLLNSVGANITPADAHRAYKSFSSMNNEETIKKLLKQNNIQATLKTFSLQDGGSKAVTEFVMALQKGYGILTRVGAGIYTSNGHWLVVADIRPTQLSSSTGYDIYIVTSSGLGRGWQRMETVTENQAYPYAYYIED